MGMEPMIKNEVFPRYLGIPILFFALEAGFLDNLDGGIFEAFFP